MMGAPSCSDHSPRVRGAHTHRTGRADMAHRTALRPAPFVVPAPNVMLPAGLPRQSQRLAVLVRLRFSSMWCIGRCLAASEQG